MVSLPLIPVLGVIVLALSFPARGVAQPTPWMLGFSEWQRMLHIDLRDQRHGHGGLFSDRGSSARYTPRMDHEYHLDLRTAGFDTWWYDGWDARTNGFRSTAGSIDRSAFATTTDFRHRETIGARHAFAVEGRQQDDLSARRLFIEVSYHFNLTGRHTVGIGHSAGSFKPDLDLNVLYSGQLRRLGEVDAGLILLDYANNFIYNVLGVDPALDDTIRSYTRPPVLLHARWRSPAEFPIALDVVAGVKPPSHASIERQSDSQFAMLERHAYRYAGAQVSTTFGPLIAGLRHRYVEESRAFQSPEGSSAERSYEARQRLHHTGIMTGAWWPLLSKHRLRASAELALEIYQDGQTGSRFVGASVGRPFQLRERRIEGAIQLALIPQARGVRAGMGFYSDARSYSDGMDVLEATYLLFRQWYPNHRLSVHLGYQPRPGVFIEAGTSFDVDGDAFYEDGRGLTRFDGGFGRLQVTW
jgi:hypothetical protein